MSEDGQDRDELHADDPGDPLSNEADAAVLLVHTDHDACHLGTPTIEGNNV